MKQSNLFFGVALLLVSGVFGAAAYIAFGVGDYHTTTFCTTLAVILALASGKEARDMFQ